MRASREYIENLRRDRARLDVELQKYRRQVEMVSSRIRQLEAAAEGLDFLLQDYGTAAPSGSNGWADLSRRQAVLRVLRDATKPLLPAEIAKELAEHGRDDNPTQVSGALYGLRMSNKAEPLPDNGGWVSVGDDESTSTDPDTDEGSRLTLVES